MSSFEFITTEFQFSHGHTPRGRGSWAFIPADSYHPAKDYLDLAIWSPSMTYTEAKKWYMDATRDRGPKYRRVIVLP